MAIITTLTAQIIDEHCALTLTQVVETLHVPQDIIREMIDEGLLQPHTSAEQEWLFDSHCLTTLRLAANLLYDLEINNERIKQM